MGISSVSGITAVVHAVFAAVVAVLYLSIHYRNIIEKYKEERRKLRNEIVKIISPLIIDFADKIRSTSSPIEQERHLDELANNLRYWVLISYMEETLEEIPDPLNNLVQCLLTIFLYILYMITLNISSELALILSAIMIFLCFTIIGDLYL
nr:hypothetical protein [Candidatus Baldrarchaeota archaeon]